MRLSDPCGIEVWKSRYRTSAETHPQLWWGIISPHENFTCAGPGSLWIPSNVGHSMILWYNTYPASLLWLLPERSTPAWKTPGNIPKEKTSNFFLSKKGTGGQSAQQSCSPCLHLLWQLIWRINWEEIKSYLQMPTETYQKENSKERISKQS